MRLTIDFETRSCVDLIRCGAYRYAEDLSTEVLCLAMKVDADTPLLWVPDLFKHLIEGHPIEKEKRLIGSDYVSYLVSAATNIEAHNVSFERAIWRGVMVAKHGFLDLDPAKLRCSMAKVAASGLPQSLEDAGKALRLPIQKDIIGRRIMLKMCKPRKPLAQEKKENPNWENKVHWHEKPNEFKKLCEYCIQDVEAEHALSKSIRDLEPKEQKVFALDQEINARGVKVDSPMVAKIMSGIREYEANEMKQVPVLTEGLVNTTGQVEAIRKWLSREGVPTLDLTSATVRKLLRTEIPPNVRKVLKLRQALGKSSVSKFKAMLTRASMDGRVRGSLVYHRARTGRWAGKGLQPHNFPRTKYESEDVEFIASARTKSVEAIYGDKMSAYSKCLRSMLIPEPGNSFIGADYASIEARVLAWLAGEPEPLRAFKEGLDIYSVAATTIYGVPYEQVTPETRNVGKVAVLALGYQGWVGAFAQIAEAYGVSYPTEQKERLTAAVYQRKLQSKRAKSPDFYMPIEISESEIFEEWAVPIITNWRLNNPRIVSYWGAIEAAAKETIKTGKPHACGRVQFGIREGSLLCKLPSGRLMTYREPGLRISATKYSEKEVITFWGVASDKDHVLEGTKKWGLLQTYGGKLTENIVQATARDILAEALLRLDEDKRFSIVLHVHDEIISEIDERQPPAIEGDYVKHLTAVPDWAEGCPIGAKAWIGKRYQK